MSLVGDTAAGVLIRDARVEDLPRILALLESALLPALGVAEHIQTFLVAERNGEVIGSVGLEVYGEEALLRSAVVDERNRNAGLGTKLYNSLLERARSLGIKRLVLLTNTAEEFFRRKGFHKVDQKAITGPVTTSVEFTGACPSHAACMVLESLAHQRVST
jgi:amino-acid N-acetyltransferase